MSFHHGIIVATTTIDSVTIISHQIPLKQLFCNLRNTNIHTQTPLTPANLFVGVGSDEAIDALLRAFCRPGHDQILTCPPTYGMYSVSAQTNDISIVKVPLLTTPNTESEFTLDIPAIEAAIAADTEHRIKLIYICSPGNPTGSLVPKSQIEHLLAHKTYRGLIVLDEAYIDFANSDPINKPNPSSLAQLATNHPNLVVMQTLSKAFGLAGIRLGVAFTSPEIATLLNSLKAPYNISSPTSAIAMHALSPANLARANTNVAKLITQRSRLIEALPQIPGIGKIRAPNHNANFILVEILSLPSTANDKEQSKPSNEAAMAVYTALAENKGVVVRFRGKEVGCLGCLRVTVGTEEEVNRFLEALERVLGEYYAGIGGGSGGEKAAKKESLVIT